MGLFVVNFVFGFASVLLFLAAFGAMLGILTLAGALVASYLLLDYMLSQGWILFKSLFTIKSILVSLLGSGITKIGKFFASVFSNKKEQLLLRYGN